MIHDDQSVTPDAPAPSYLPTPNPYKDQLQALRDAGGWISIDKDAVAKFLQRTADSGDIFTPEEAKADLIYWMNCAKIKPQSYYAKRWKWNKVRVHRLFKSLHLGCNSDVTPMKLRVTKRRDSRQISQGDETPCNPNVTPMKPYVVDYTDLREEKPESPSTTLLPNPARERSPKPEVSQLSQDVTTTPTPEEVAAYCRSAQPNIVPSFAQMLIDRAVSRGWLDDAGTTIRNWKAYVSKSWRTVSAGWREEVRQHEQLKQRSEREAATPAIDTRPRIDGILVGEGHTSLSQHSLDSLYRSKQKRLADEASYRNGGIAATGGVLAAAPVPEPGVLVADPPDADRRFQDDTHRMAS